MILLNIVGKDRSCYMEPKELYPFIFKRKSIRQYEQKPIDPIFLERLAGFMKSVHPLYSQIKMEMKVVFPKEVQRNFMAKPGHYILFFSETSDGYLENAGFMLQQVDLFLSASGFGSCWQMIARPHSSARTDSSLQYIILLAIGIPKETLYREALSEFDRKPLDQISTVADSPALLEAARLAPSGTNNQPWFFTGANGLIHAHSIKSGSLKALIVGKMNRISVGIALCHIWLAALNQGKHVEVISDPDAQAHPPAKYDYLLTLKIQ